MAGNSDRPSGWRMHMLNGRPLSLMARNIVRPSNYLALSRAAFVYEKPLEAVGRYFLGRGHYPSSLVLRTPLGPQPIRLFCSADSITVHEIFCRKDYSFSKPPRMVVDLGSNIGISALFFLTRSSSTY